LPPCYAAVILADVYGRARVVVARQPALQANGDSDYCLRAYRAADGKALWTTESQAQLKDVSFTGTPAVCGRFTYAVALSIPAAADGTGDQRVSLLLVALDTLTGELRWQTTLGIFTLSVQDRARWSGQQPWDGVWEQSEPLVAGDAVYVTPNSGLAAAAGRFDGKLRWLRPYPTVGGDGPLPPRSREDLRRKTEERLRQSLRGDASKSALSVEPALGARWRNTSALCGTGADRRAAGYYASPRLRRRHRTADLVDGRPGRTNPDRPNRHHHPLRRPKRRHGDRGRAMGSRRGAGSRALARASPVRRSLR